MNILVTGSSGFIGKNICVELENRNYNVFKFDRTNTTKELENLIESTDFVFHLAGVNRPINNSEFYDGNADFTITLINFLKKQNRKIPLLLSSSIQATNDSDYGRSKKMAEDYVFEYGSETGSCVYVFRLANAFGKWCKPNYNSVVATFCHNIANDRDIIINNGEVKIPFVYIDDIVNEFITCISQPSNNEVLSVYPIYEIQVKEVADLIYQFKNARVDLSASDMSNEFTKKLYSTYLSYLPREKFIYPLDMKIDDRGSFTEFIKDLKVGQISINITKPGITKGNHWHHTKVEKFLVVSGKGIIRFRDIFENDVFEYHVSGDKLEVVDIPPGYTHNIENCSDVDLVTVMWCNENFNSNKPDTYFNKV